MNETEWNACNDPDKMLRFLRESGKLSDRKARLFACVAARRVWHLLTDERSRRAVEAAEGNADGLASDEELETALTQAHHVFASVGHAAEGAIAWASAWTADSPAHLAAQNVVGWTAKAQRNTKRAMRENARLVRDIFGPLPFRLVTIPSSVRMWQDGTVVRQAQAAYDERELPSGHLNLALLGVLADAMEKAGCTDQEVLGHLRGPGPHTRGCWCVDLLLGKS